MIVAFDLDGTLADITHRLPLIRGTAKDKDWPAFYRACVFDKPVPTLITLYQNLLDAGHRMEIWSGRSDIVRTETENWLAKHGIKRYSALRMRTDGDYRADDIVKAEWLEELGEAQWPALAFDDRARVVQMWRAHGILCAQVAPGAF
jgi:phosphoglycolate phosphatase-like HAD superfamily hydrolase